MDISIKRKELISWLQNLEDSSILLKVEKLKQKHSKSQEEKLLSIDEAKQCSISKIEKWEEN